MNEISCDALQFIPWYIEALQTIEGVVKPFGYRARIVFDIAGGSEDLLVRMQVGKPGVTIDISIVNMDNPRFVVTREDFLRQVQRYVELETGESFTGLTTDKLATALQALYVWASVELIECKS